jgi:hypothetical protein
MFGDDCDEVQCMSVSVYGCDMYKVILIKVKFVHTFIMPVSIITFLSSIFV